MMSNETIKGVVLNEVNTLTLVELSNACLVQQDWIIELVNEGILEPDGHSQQHWRFSGQSVQRVRLVRNLESDLGVNLAGAALIVELLNENKRLRTRLTLYE